MKRICTECKMELEATLDNFNTNNRSKDGLRSKCKKCDTNFYKRDDYYSEYKKGDKFFLLKLGVPEEDIPVSIKPQTIIRIKCINGHVLEKKYISIKNKGNACRECLRLKPYYEIKSILENEGLELITKEEDFLGASKSKLEYICDKGHVCKDRCSEIREGKRCKVCSLKKFSESKKKNIDDIIKAVESEGYLYKGLIDDYHNNLSRMLVECKKGHAYETSVANFISGARCNNCKIEHFKMENCPFWKGGITSLSKYLRTKIDDWKAESLKFNNYQCFVTGESGYLEVHHHVNFSKITEETLKELNLEVKERIADYGEHINAIEKSFIKKHYEYGYGIAMKKDIHSLFHKIYSKKNNTMEQVLEFKQDYLNGKYDDVLSA